jgi:serpin B
MTIDAFQKTFFKMDEEGAEAAAVTVINGCTSPGPADVYVTLDHPFIYAIVEDNTQCPLFIGYYGK